MGSDHFELRARVREMQALPISDPRSSVTSGWRRAGRAGLWFFATFIATWTLLAQCLAPVAEMLAGVLGSPAHAVQGSRRPPIAAAYLLLAGVLLMAV